MNADPHVQLRLRVELGQTGLQIERGANGLFGVAFAGSRSAEDRQQSIAQILQDKAGVFLDDAAAHGVNRGDEVAPVFGVHLFGQCGRADDVAEEDGDDAALFGGRGSGELGFQRGDLMTHHLQGGIDRVAQHCALRIENLQGSAQLIELCLLGLIRHLTLTGLTPGA